MSVPLTLRIGKVRSPEFKTDAHQNYVIKVEAGKTLPFESQCCLMGIAGGMFKCDKQPVIQAEWAIWSDGSPVARGSSQGGDYGSFSSDSLARYLGYFSGESGKNYVLEVNFTRDGSELAATNPRLVMEVDGATYEDYAVGSALNFALALLMAIIGTMMLIFATIRFWWNRRNGVE